MSYYAHPTSCIDPGAIIGDGTHIWNFCHIRGTAIIGAKCNIGQNVYVDSHVTIGTGCKIQNNVSIYEHVTLEDNVFCGPGAVFTNVRNPRAAIKKMDVALDTRIGYGATLGANCTIVCGVTIGKFAFVGAGSVVTKDVPDHALVTGNPARQRGWVCQCGEKLDNSFFCKACGQRLSFPNHPDDLKKV